jgi:polyhydroxyalkanoate synthesis regulator phasin
MIAKAHEISLEAGSKMAKAMKDVIFAAAGLTPFAADSAKDLINYMVRRGQMSAEEAERILTEIEDAAEKRNPGAAAKAAADAAAAASTKKSAPAAKKAAPAAAVKEAPAKKEPAVAAKKEAPAAKEPAAAKAPAAKKTAAAPKKK